MSNVGSSCLDIVNVRTRVSRKFKDRNIKDPKILINFMIQSNDFALQL